MLTSPAAFAIAVEFAFPLEEVEVSLVVSWAAPAALDGMSGLFLLFRYFDASYLDALPLENVVETTVVPLAEPEALLIELPPETLVELVTVVI
jgi:hypothetical protein